MPEEAQVLAYKDLERLILARELMSRVTAKTRSNSKLVDLMLAQLEGALPRDLTG